MLRGTKKFETLLAKKSAQRSNAPLKTTQGKVIQMKQELAIYEGAQISCYGNAGCVGTVSGVGNAGCVGTVGCVGNACGVGNVSCANSACEKVAVRGTRGMDTASTMDSTKSTDVTRRKIEVGAIIRGMIIVLTDIFLAFLVCAALSSAQTWPVAASNADAQQSQAQQIETSAR